MDEPWRKKKIVVKISQLQHDLELGVQGSDAAADFKRHGIAQDVDSPEILLDFDLKKEDEI